MKSSANSIENSNTKDCQEELRKAMDNLSRKQRGKTVIFCELAQRYDKPYLNKKIANVNSYLADLALQYDNVYLLKHDNVRADFKKDGLHFNQRGIAKLCLNIRHIIRKSISSP